MDLDTSQEVWGRIRSALLRIQMRVNLYNSSMSIVGMNSKKIALVELLGSHHLLVKKNL